MQITDTLLMVRPAAFGANEETAATNFFQSTDTKADPRTIQQAFLEYHLSFQDDGWVHTVEKRKPFLQAKC